MKTYYIPPKKKELKQGWSVVIDHACQIWGNRIPQRIEKLIIYEFPNLERIQKLIFQVTKKYDTW